MSYNLQYALSTNVPECLEGEVIVWDDHYLPRVGETIDFEGNSFTVDHVFHTVENNRSQLPTVSVK